MNLAYYDAMILSAFGCDWPKPPSENPFKSDGYNRPSRCRRGTRPLACDAKRLAERRAARKKERRNRRKR